MIDIRPAYIANEVVDRSRVGRSDICRVPGCFKRTKELKPFCIDHLEFGNYPKAIMAELDRREKEKERLSDGQRIGPNSHLARDILSYLTINEQLPLADATHIWSLTKSQVETLFWEMARSGLVRLHQTIRGTISVQHLKPTD